MSAPGDELVGPGARLVDAGSGCVLAGAALRARVDSLADELRRLAAGVLFVRMRTDLSSVLRYLGAFTARRPVALLDAAQPDLAALTARFAPVAVLGAPVGAAPPRGYRHADVAGPAWVRIGSAAPPHPALAVLLSTSGSTGDPRLVRLSRAAIVANADAIAEVLDISADDLAVTSLPLHYSYGMSVLNSHLRRGAGILIESSGVAERAFWQAVGTYRATALAGVPFHYDMLDLLRIDLTAYPSLRVLTQAGGRLPPGRAVDFERRLRAVGGRFHVMYGQTEAGPRMATMPAGGIADKPGSVGPALPGGEFRILTDNGVETARPGTAGEIIYRGPNVMMGYAEQAADLVLGDLNGGLLRTGDLGWLDEEGFVYVTGRLSRIGKVYGVRVNLDDVERLLRCGPGARIRSAAVDRGDRVAVFLENGSDQQRCWAAAELAKRTRTHPSAFDVRSVPVLPLLASGKVDYRALAQAADASDDGSAPDPVPHGRVRYPHPCRDTPQLVDAGIPEEGDFVQHSIAGHDPPAGQRLSRGESRPAGGRR